jgi:hypothetical protein
MNHSLAPWHAVAWRRRLQLLVWLCAGTVTDRLWAASRRLAHWTATHARRAELQLAVETENTWNGEVSHER